MANVFISYSRRDRDRVVALASALEAEGLSVWWDPNLVPGRRFRQMIAEQLAAADCVVVVWTQASLESDWVQDEAEEARQREALIPVKLEPVIAPAGFRQLQAADLSQWTGSRQHPEFRALVSAAQALAAVAAKERASSRPGAPLGRSDHQAPLSDAPAVAPPDARPDPEPEVPKHASPPPASPTAAIPAADTTVVQPTDMSPRSWGKPRKGEIGFLPIAIGVSLLLGSAFLLNQCSLASQDSAPDSGAESAATASSDNAAVSSAAPAPTNAP